VGDSRGKDAKPARVNLSLKMRLCRWRAKRFGQFLYSSGRLNDLKHWSRTAETKECYNIRALDETEVLWLTVGQIEEALKV
jgi:hypothetical protein